MKDIVLLGATGSVGSKCIDIIREENRNLIAISFGENINKAIEIIKQFTSIKFVCSLNKEDASSLHEMFPYLKVYCGKEGLIEFINNFYDLTVINAIVGFAGLRVTYHSILNRNDMLLANKETLTMAGNIIMPLVKKMNVNLVPIDSEHSSLHQMLMANEADEIYLTASGGSFRNLSRDELQHVTKEEALSHPTWKMGDKITIDSATMFNKALEIIEAHYLFGFSANKINAIIHYESLVHSMIKLKNGAMLLNLSKNDMRIAASYAINYPTIKNTKYNEFDIERDLSLNFKKIDLQRYPLVAVAYKVIEFGTFSAVVFNAANDAAVKLFLNDKIPFLKIEELIIEYTLKNDCEMMDHTIDCLEKIYIETYDEIIKRNW